MKNSILIAILLLFSIGFIACEKEDPVIPNEEELITTLKLSFQPVGGGSTVEFSFQDLDGDGGDAPIITTGVLAPNTSYTCSLELLNELETPPEDITEEVEEEGDEHQLFYGISGADLSFTYTDQDANGNPIGLLTSSMTGEASTGTLKVILRHQPTKPNDGNPDNAGGETDIEVTFDVVIR
jgi:hypothetical protein